MEEIITDYFENNYQVKYELLSNYMLFDKSKGVPIKMTLIWKEVEVMFSIERDELVQYWEAWIEPKLIKIENDINTLKCGFYGKSGTIL